MKILCCGSRKWTNESLIYEVLSELPGDSVIMHGGAPGADSMVDKAARKLGFAVWEAPFEGDKSEILKGDKRALQMLDQKPLLVIAFNKNISTSKGTLQIFTEAKKRGIPVRLIT